MFNNKIYVVHFGLKYLTKLKENSSWNGHSMFDLVSTGRRRPLYRPLDNLNFLAHQLTKKRTGSGSTQNIDVHIQTAHSESPH